MESHRFEVSGAKGLPAGRWAAGVGGKRQQLAVVCGRWHMAGTVRALNDDFELRVGFWSQARVRSGWLPASSS